MKIYREIGSMYLVIQPDKDGFFRPVYEIEVDEIVECKDCKHLQESGHCDKTCLWIGNKEDGGCDDFFCGCGERKTE